MLGGSSDFLQTPEIKEALREYYETHRLHVNFPNGTSAIVGAMGRQEPITKYVGGSSVPVKQEPAPKKGGLFEGDDEDEYGKEKQPEDEQ